MVSSPTIGTLSIQPRREGPVTFRLRLGQEPPVEQVEEAPSRAGICEAMLTFPKAGDWNVSLVVPSEEGEKTIAFPPVKVFANTWPGSDRRWPGLPSDCGWVAATRWPTA
jgi:hypothetical protein